MAVADMLIAQLTDPFRIGLVVMLLVTAARTSGAVGNWIPLALGAVFVAVLIPITLGSEQGDRAVQIGVGIVSNAIILAVALAAKAAFDAMKRTKP